MLMQEVAVAGGAQLTAEIDLGNNVSLEGVIVGASFEGTQIGFVVAEKAGGTFVNLYDEAGNRVLITVTSSRAYGFKEDVRAQLAPWRYIKLETQTAQTDALTLTVIGRGRS